MVPLPKKLYTTEQAGEYLIVPPKTILRWIKEGKLKAHKVGRTLADTGGSVRGICLRQGKRGCRGRIGPGKGLPGLIFLPVVISLKTGRGNERKEVVFLKCPSKTKCTTNMYHKPVFNEKSQGAETLRTVGRGDATRTRNLRFWRPLKGLFCVIIIC